MTNASRPTEGEFAELKRIRDESLARVIAAAVAQLWPGAEPAKVHAHVSYGGGTTECYCACPDGPCQHEWTGEWRFFDDDCGGEVTCARCGMGAMAHSLRSAP